MDKLHHFLSFIGYYRRSYYYSHDITKSPLNKLLRKDTKSQWSALCQSPFEDLKKALCIKLTCSTLAHRNSTSSSLTQVIIPTLESLLRQLMTWWSDAHSLYIRLIFQHAAKIVCKLRKKLCSLSVCSQVWLVLERSRLHITLWSQTSRAILIRRYENPLARLMGYKICRL